MDKFNDFEELCYRIFYENLNIKEFERFIYDETNRWIINDDDYLELISLNYNSKHTKYEVKKILKEYIDFGIFESYRVTSYIDGALCNDDNLGSYLIEIYELYCCGYYFLRELALGFGLTCTYTPKEYSEESWYDLSIEEKRRLHKLFQPKLNECLRRALNWINNGDVIITGTKGDINRWEYIDHRSKADKEYDNFKGL
jgi:hypothetical protein